MARACGSYPQCQWFDSTHRHQSNIFFLRRVFNPPFLFPKNTWKGEDMAHPVIVKVRLAGEEQGWIDSSEPLVVAVSGGGDSMALLFALREIYTGKMTVAHIEHGIRGSSSMADADFVREIAEKNGLETIVGRFSIPRQKLRGESIEEAARRIRYDFLEKTREAAGASWIAVGHNSDDAAETVLLNLLRGTGLAGLCGLPGRRGAIIRPLIHCNRLELRNFLRDREIPWREDETNRDTSYLRNRVRLELLPYLARDYNPSVTGRLLAMRKTMLPCREVLEERGRNAARLLRRDLPLALSAWDVFALRRLDPSTFAELFRCEASRLGLKTLDYDRMTNLQVLVRSGQGWRFQWEQNLELRAGAGFLVLLDRDVFDRASEEPLGLEEPQGKIRWGFGSFEWEPATIRKTGLSDFSAILPFSPEKPRILTSDRALRKSKLELLPWFYRKSWPTVAIGDKMTWTPFWGKPDEIRENDFSLVRVSYFPDGNLGVL